MMHGSHFENDLKPLRRGRKRVSLTGVQKMALHGASDRGGGGGGARGGGAMHVVHIMIIMQLTISTSQCSQLSSFIKVNMLIPATFDLSFFIPMDYISLISANNRNGNKLA